MYDVKQFKLTNGQEILCEVIEWPEEGHHDMIVRNAMEIVRHQGMHDVYYAFRPWLHYNESSDSLVIINSNHISATTTPNKHLFGQYSFSVKDAQSVAEERDETAKVDIADKMQKISDALVNLMNGDSAAPKKSNVIKFPEREF